MYIICTYDVNEKKCSKIMKILRKYLFHVQKSVFEGTLTPHQYQLLQEELSHIVSKDDSIIFFFSYNDKQVYKKELGIQSKSRNIILK